MLQLLKNKKLFVFGMVFAMAACMFLTASNGFADDAIMKIKEFKPPPTNNTPITLQEIQSGPNYFTKGTVDAVSDKWITINDHQFFIASDARLSCSVGDFVGIKVNDENKVISCERIIVY